MKKALIITYYWPPAGGPGVQRWLKFAKYLPQFGIEPVLYTPLNPHYPITDPSLEEDIPHGITVIKRSIIEPYKVASLFSGKKATQISKGILPEGRQSFAEKVLLWIRGNLFIPDARKYWVKPSVKYLATYLAKERIDTVITTGPPHSLHLIGFHLKKKIGIRWIADFRDPWTSIGYHKELKLLPFSARKHKKLEKKVLTHADSIIVTSYTTRQEFEQLTPVPITVITNGYDDLPHIEAPLTEKFTLSHIGSLLTGRNPSALWEALSGLISENSSFKTNFQLQLIGTVSHAVLNDIRLHGLLPYCKMLGYVSHARATELQRTSQVLLLLEANNKEAGAIIPGKVFEYMVSGRPIIAVGPAGWEVESLLEKTRTGYYFAHQDKEALKNQISRLYETYKTGSLQTQPIGIDAYHRKNLTEKLANLIFTTNKIPPSAPK